LKCKFPSGRENGGRITTFIIQFVDNLADRLPFRAGLWSRTIPSSRPPPVTVFEPSGFIVTATRAESSPDCATTAENARQRILPPIQEKKARKGAFILLTKEKWSGLKWGKVD
jgi:hypothetical protein